MAIEWSEIVDPGEDHLSGPAVTSSQIDQAERKLGLALPDAYREMLEYSNGAVLSKKFVRTPFATSWSETGFAIEGFLGIGYEDGIDGEFGSDYLIAEWGYPNIGLVVGQCPSAGHDVVMLDYSDVGADSRQPSIAYVDEDRIPRRVASSFEEFIELLEEEPEE